VRKKKGKLPHVPGIIVRFFNLYILLCLVLGFEDSFFGALMLGIKHPIK
jgi:hypothetical protein